jgi:GT2 family glycosyltransferase
MSDLSEHDAAVVLVNYRSAALVERCLASVRETDAGLRLEVAVVDNASEDGSLKRLRALDVQLVPMSSNRGFGAGVNAGFRHTSAEMVIVLNPDTEVRPGALQALLSRLAEHPRTGVAAPLLEHPDGSLAPNGYRRFPNILTLFLALCVPLLYLLDHAPALNPDAMSPAALLEGRAPAHVSGAALAIRRGAYQQAGPFDESFFLYLEETEWQSRVVSHGWDIEIVPQARVCHLIRGGGEEALSPSPYFVASALYYMRLRGVPELLTRVVLGTAIASSWLTLRLIALLPAKRARGRIQARSFASLMRELW